MSNITYKLEVKLDGQKIISFENDTTAGLVDDMNMMSNFPIKGLFDIEAWVDGGLVFGAEANDITNPVNMDKLIALAELAVEKEISEP